MSKLSNQQLKKIPPSKLLKIIEDGKIKLKKDQIFKDMCKKYNTTPDIIDIIPVMFSELEVSARTSHGIIYLNINLLKDGDFINDIHYLLHECEHFLKSTTGDRPTKGAKDGDYLENPDEISAFQPQLKYIEKHYGKDKADNYAEKVLDHHEVSDKEERKEKKDNLMKMVNKK